MSRRNEWKPRRAGLHPPGLVTMWSVLIGCIWMVGTATAADVDVYPTFHAMGIIISLDPGDDSDQNAVALVDYRAAGSDWQPAYPPTRIDAGQFTGSLFFLTPGTHYDVRVAFSDPGGALDGVVLTASAATRSDIVIPPPAASYHVAPAGSGTQCTPDLPCSLSQAIALAGPGDEVVLQAGTYYQGELTLPRSGTANAPIVLRGADNQTALISGADPDTFTWNDQGQGVFAATVNAADTHLVTVDGQRLFPYDSLDNLRSLAYGLPGFYPVGTTLYLKLGNGDDPADHAIRVARYNHAFSVSRDFIYFSNLTFTHFGQGSWAKAIYFNDAGDNLVRHCVFAVNDLGIGFKRACNRNLIEHNEFFDTIFMWPWDAVKTVSGLETGGIRFYDPVNGRGNVIRYNTFHDYFDGFGVCPATTDQLTNETDVYGNVVFNVGDDGVEVDGRAANVRLWDNVFHDVLMGISLAPVYDGPVYVIGNLIYGTGAGNSQYSGSPFKFNSGYSTSGPIYLFHNTCDAVLPGNNGIYIKAPGTWQTITARNNIWSGTQYAMNDYNTTQPIDFDYDVLYTSRTDEYVYWDGLHLRDLATFQGTTGQESHGWDMQPEFEDAAAGDYRLVPDSPLIDNGIPLPGINDHYNGNGPDVGAFEADDCTADGDGDGDVDGLDLFGLASDFDAACLPVMAMDFGGF